MTLNPAADELIGKLELSPHPEGGFFRETYRDSGLIPHEALPEKYSGARHYQTAIYYLLPQGAKSSLHRIASDELWHFYLGCPLSIIQISPSGDVETIRLGQDVFNGETLQHVVPAGYWFGAIPEVAGDYSLVGCTVAPGFDFADFEMADSNLLILQFPHAREAIERLSAKAPASSSP